ncbi:hypothetical protein BDZ45DRAFT_745377 [Acephala macrosclerotiorum]|nr:hypothetical protein BDZ45DRAFT_745377 [Acephala macrosclerotiorum]
MHSLLALTALLGTTSALPGMLSNMDLPRDAASKKILPSPRLVSRDKVSSPILIGRDNTPYPPFLGPRPGDVRSPCPGLNALANHVQFIFSYGEAVIYLSTMGDPTTGVVLIEYVGSLFEEERLPYEEGWRPTAEPTTLGSLAAMIFELNIANGEELPEGLTLTESTLKAALRGLDPITGKVLDPTLQTIGVLLGITSSS